MDNIAQILFLLLFISTQNSMLSLGMNIICKESDRIALLTFKQHLKDFTDGLSSWSGENCCRWAGVVCNNRTDHVVQLQLQNLGLGGELNPSLQELKQLRHLDLSFNKFEGISIPDFLGSLQSLKYLNLSRAGFGGMVPHQLGNLSNLRYLDLSYSGLEKELTVVGNFQWISRLSSLEYLDLSYVNLYGAANWFYAVNMLPSLLVLRLPNCHLSGAFHSLLSVNFTSLEVLDLSYNYLNFDLPKWLYSLTNIEQLDLSFNTFQGTISTSIGNLTKLTRLSLSSNSFQGTISASIGNLTKLTHLSLSSNNFQGTISASIGNLTKLIHLSLSNNSFQGTISASIGNLTKLTLLDLSYNKLEGEIPITLGNLIKLQSLDFRGNKLEGEMPTALGNLCKLQFLYFQSNQFSGRLPNELGRLRNLNRLVLTDNKLNGSLPKSLGNLSNLVELSITGNEIKGVISEVHFVNLTNLKSLSMDFLVLKFSPEWVPPFQLIYAELSTCQLGPSFPIWLRTQKFLNYLHLSRTGISGTVPTWFWNNFFLDLSPLPYSTLDLSHNELHGELPRVSPNLRVLDLSNNSFFGSISTFLCNPISDSNDLDTLDLSNNLLFGDLSDCWVHWTSLRSIRLGKNKITGKIQSSIGSISGLLDLQLSNNILSGELPSSLRNCTSLVIIDLGGNGLTGILPTWLGESLLNLIFLRLRSNKFYDEIPLQLCNLTSLQVLDIAHNHLQGSIPICFDKFSGMATKSGILQLEFDETTLGMKGWELEFEGDYNFALVTSLDLSKNSLSGEIPEELASLIRLRSLNLSENRFTGKIPEKIGNMVLLESLDFSNNNVAGVIPQSISGLTFLSSLNLSYNNLSGKIPLSIQLQSFNESSFIGNQDLCGIPLKKCSGENPPQNSGDTDDREVEEEDCFEMKWFYMSMGLGVTVGFWAFWGVIVLKRSWRNAYFRFLDDMKDKLCLLF